MDPHLADAAMDESESPAVIKKIKRLSNGTNEQESPEQTTEVKTSSLLSLENGMACNGTGELEEHNSDSREEETGVSKDQNSTTSVVSSENACESASDKTVVAKGSKLAKDLENIHKSAKEDDGECQKVCDSRTGKNCDSVCGNEGSKDNCEIDDGDDDALNNVKSSSDYEDESSVVCNVDKVEGSTLDVDKVEGSTLDVDRVEGSTTDVDNDEMDTDAICVIASVTGDVSNEDAGFDNEDEKFDEHVSELEQGAPECEDHSRRRSKRGSDKGGRKRYGIDKESKDTESLDRNKDIFDQWGAKNLSKKDIAENDASQRLNKDTDPKESKHLQNCNRNKEAADSEKENIDKEDSVSPGAVGNEGKCQKRKTPELKQAEKQSNHSDVAGDDVEIIGESKMVHVNTPKSLTQTSQNIVFVPTGLPGSLGGQGGAATSSNLVASSAINHGQTPSSIMQGLTSGIPIMSTGFAFHGGVHGQGSQNLPLMVPSVAPPKPKSSLDQIELIRWEIQNRINTRPKYFKPNSASELGPLAKFLFDIGSDLIKEAVYHDLVKIQSKKKGDDKLSAKEKDDLEKLKEIEKDLYATIGHLKLKLKQKCKVCHFQTESHNVMFYHKQYPHEDNKFLRCAHCTFSTKQAVTFKFHLEAEHAMQPKLHDKKAFYECDLCPYENNQEQKLTLHKQRCLKQFRPLFNLHPSCLSGAEINLCLENIFYRPIVPKNLKLLQQKHAQQQAALAEARRQQAQMQVLAAQKNAAAVAAKKQQQQIQKRMPVPPAPRAKAPPVGRMPVPPKASPIQQRFTTPTSTKGPCPTVATMLNAKQNPAAPLPGAAGTTTASGFEVCEICGGYVKDRKALRIHFFYAHRIDLPFNLFERNQAPLYCATCYVRFWTAHGLRKHIDTHKEENQTRGVVGKCISCGHHVLNLLLHMRVVHNREMQHYINALMCMFCGSHFSSHQECERHILKAHGHIDPTTGTLKSAPNAPTPPQQPPQKAPANNKKPGNNNLVKGSVCVLCNLNFGRNVDLTRHCMRMHHTCMKCGMVVIDKASLMKHTCLSSPSGTRDCTMCGESGFHPAYYVKHLRDKHLKRFSIRVRKLDKSTIEQWIKRPYPFNEQEREVLVEISDSDEDVALNKLKTSPATAPAKRPRIGPASKIGRPCQVPEKLNTSPSGVGVVASEDKVKVAHKGKHVVANKEKVADEDKDVMVDKDKEKVAGEDKDVIVDEDNYVGLDEGKDVVADEDKEKVADEDNDVMVDEGKEKANEVNYVDDEDKDLADEDNDLADEDNDLADDDKDALDSVKETEDTNCDDDKLPSESSPGQKRKSVVESPECDRASKRKK